MCLCVRVSVTERVWNFKMAPIDDQGSCPAVTGQRRGSKRLLRGFARRPVVQNPVTTAGSGLLLWLGLLAVLVNGEFWEGFYLYLFFRGGGNRY